MAATLARLGGVVLLALLTWLAIVAVRQFIERRRRQVLVTAAPLSPASGFDDVGRPVRILAFSSDDCAQCHRLQAPALRRVTEARPDAVGVVEIDAPTSPELTARYRVLTLPTTVVLDAGGQARAVNYGFANSERLLAQVDALLDFPAGTASRTA